MAWRSFDDSIHPPAASAVHADHHVPDCGKRSFRRGTHSGPPFGTSSGAELMVSGVVAVAADDDDDDAAAERSFGIHRTAVGLAADGMALEANA